MPILNLSKVKKEEAKEEVPDELPSLPPEIEKKEEKPVEQKKEEPAPVSIVAEKHELAPDELPPIQKKEPLIVEEAPKEVIHKQEPVKVEEKPKILDQRLYFSKLIKKLNDGASIDEIGNEIKWKDVVSSLNENLQQNKKIDDGTAVEKEIKVMISDLQKLEKEWSVLKIEIEQKKEKFEQAERKIKEHTEMIKQKFTLMEELRRRI